MRRVRSTGGCTHGRGIKARSKNRASYVNPASDRGFVRDHHLDHARALDFTLALTSTNGRPWGCGHLRSRTRHQAMSGRISSQVTWPPVACSSWRHLM